MGVPDSIQFDGAREPISAGVFQVRVEGAVLGAQSVDGSLELALGLQAHGLHQRVARGGLRFLFGRPGLDFHHLAAHPVS